MQHLTRMNLSSAALRRGILVSSLALAAAPPVQRRGCSKPLSYGCGKDKYSRNAWLFARIICRRPCIQALGASKIFKARY